MNDAVAIKIIDAPDSKFNELIMNPQKAAEVNLLIKKVAYLKYGDMKRFVHLSFSADVSKNEIRISKALLDELHLPVYPLFELFTRNNEIKIGPHIGLLITKEDKNLTPRRLHDQLNYLRDYSTLHGSVVVFALDKIDKTARLIEGYCYNPLKADWQRAKFPYPSAVYRSIGLSPQWKNFFLSEIGETLFNSNYFSKWEMYRWFSSSEEIRRYLPFTMLYKSSDDVLSMLNLYDTIYIKPVSGLRGRGIMKVSLENGEYLFSSHENGVNQKKLFRDCAQATDYIHECLRHGHYLIQQAVELIEFEDGPVDFRCIMQKTQLSKWTCLAVIGRNGQAGSIVSNISGGGRAFEAVELLNKAVRISNYESRLIKYKIEALAYKICDVLDEYGIHCGILGLDIGVDKFENLWLFEINNRDPDPTIALDIHDEQLYYSIKTGLLFYAKALAGFKTE